MWFLSGKTHIKEIKFIKSTRIWSRTNCVASHWVSSFYSIVSCVFNVLRPVLNEAGGQWRVNMGVGRGECEECDTKGQEGRWGTLSGISQFPVERSLRVGFITKALHSPLFNPGFFTFTIQQFTESHLVGAKQTDDNKVWSFITKKKTAAFSKNILRFRILIKHWA